MKAKYSKVYNSIILPQGVKLLVFKWKKEYFIDPPEDLLVEISDKGFTLEMYASTISKLCTQIDKMVEGGVNFDMLFRFTYNIKNLQEHYKTIK